MTTKIIDLREINLLSAFMMLTPAQCRAARGWLDWNQKDLAGRAKVSMSTIRDFESGKRTPIANNLEGLRRAFSAAGIQLLFDGGRAAGIAAVASDETATAAESGTTQESGART